MPLLVLSYAAYKSAASRMEDADRHLRDVEQLYQATVETLAIAVDAKDQVTHGHIRRVQRHTLFLARALGMREPLELNAITAASLLARRRQTGGAGLRAEQAWYVSVGPNSTG